MKFRVTLKDPDTLSDAIDEAVKKQLKDIGITDLEEFHALSNIRCQKMQDLCKEWFDYGEMLTVEIDTDAKTCVVVKKRE